MNNQKIKRIMFVLVPTLLVLTLIWGNTFAPLLCMTLIWSLIFFVPSGSIHSFFAKQKQKQKQKQIVYYQPTQQPIAPQPSPRKNPPLDFDLTAEEYRLLSQQYRQGYQPQVPQPQPQQRNISERDMPKQDRYVDYEQPQAQYPEEIPPMA